MKSSSDPVVMSAMGDISLGDHLYCMGFGVRSKGKKDGVGSFFDGVKNILDSSSIVFANLETVLSDHGYEKNEISSRIMRGTPKFAKELAISGFNALNVANNHSFQHGENPFWETVSSLQEHGISAVGISSKDKHYCSKPVLIEKGGMKFGFLGYSFIKNVYQQGNVPYCLVTEQNIFNDIIQFRKKVDFLVVSCHWGDELMDQPSLDTILMARKMVDKGASIIIGHHPHVFQGIEKYRHALIFYSVGNFIFDLLWCKSTLYSAILNISFFINGSMSYELIPVKMNVNYQPQILTGKEKGKFLKYVDCSSCAIEKTLERGPGHELGHEKKVDLLDKKVRNEKVLFLLKNFYRINPKDLIQIVRYKISL